jgi:superfamily II DNA or RNA helicase
MQAPPVVAPASGANTVSITVRQNRFHVHGPYSLKDRLKAVPGREWDAKAQAWTYPATGVCAHGLNIVLQSRLLNVRADPLYAALATGHAATRAILSGNAQLLPIPKSAMVPFQHQTLGWNLLGAGDAAMLIWEMGCGKSKTVVDHIVNDPTCKRVLIVCPLAMVDTWATVQLPLHAGPAMALIDAVPLGGRSVAGRTSLAERAMRMRPDHKVVVIINYQAVWREPFAEWALAQKWDLIVADEIHRIKDPKGRASKFMDRLRPAGRRRVGLTGTPFPHDPLDIYAQMRFLDPGVFGASWSAFKAYYTVKGGFMGKEVVGYRNQPDLQRRLYSIAHRVTKEEVLDLPPFSHVSVPVTLSAPARKLYDQLASNFMADVHGGTITAANALTRLLRLQQVTGGYATIDPVDDPDAPAVAGPATPVQQIVQVDTGKLDALSEIMADLPPGEPLVVFCRFVKDMDNVRAAAAANGRTCGNLSGRGNDLKAWQAGQYNTLAVQIKSGGEGVDMTRARYAVFYSLGYSLGEYEQAAARLHRQGQRNAVTYYHLIARDTVDQKVYQALRASKNVVRAILEEGLEEK